jgi:hypothetical protein
MKTKIILFTVLFATLFFSNCDNSKDPEPTGAGTLGIEFEHIWAMSGQKFELNKMLFHPMTSDSLKFTKFQYYVSNIQLKKEDGSWWICPESYYLLDLSKPASLLLNLTDIPAGNYTEMKYIMGVDSTRNVSGAQTGALSTSNAMFWDWNSGYIMIKAEGISPNSSSKSFTFHLGGFAGVNNIVTQKSTNFNGSTLKIGSDKSPIVGITVNPARLWHTSPSVSVVSNLQMPGDKAKVMAKDFYELISFGHLHQ